MPVNEAPRKRSLLIVFMVVFIDLLGFGIVLPLLPRYGQYFAAGKLTLGMLMASFSAMQFLFAPLWGRISDRVGRRPVLLIGLAGSTVCYALFGFATSLGAHDTLLGLSALAWLFIARIGAGIAGATIPTAQAYIADCTESRERGKGMALIGAAFGLGFTFGPLIASTFASADLHAPPSAAPGYVAAVLSGLSLLAAVFWLPESLRAESRPAGRSWIDPAALAAAIRRPAIGSLLLTVFITTFAFAEFESTLSLLTQALGMSERGNFYVFAFLGFILMLSQGLLVRRLLPRVGEFRMSVAGAVLLTVGLLLVGITGELQVSASAADAATDEAVPVADMPVATDASPAPVHQPQPASRGLWMLFAVMPLSIIGFSALTPSLQALLSLTTSESEQGEVLGLGQSMSALARILGPIVGIRLFDISHVGLPYWSSAAAMAVGLVLVLSQRKTAEQARR